MLNPTLMATTETVPPAPRLANRNEDLQALRGIAALMVLLYHASHYLGVTTGDTRMLAVFNGDFGLLGVALFFALSGALMAEILPRTRPAAFLLHRVVRIYPSFVLASAILPPLLVPNFLSPFEMNWVGWIDFAVRGWSLVPIDVYGIYQLGIEWTLLFEIFYYVVLTVLAVIGLTRFLPVIAAIWLGAICVALFLLPDATLNILTPAPEILLLLPPNAAFAFGLLVPLLLRSGGARPTLAVVAVTLAILMSKFGLPIGRVLGGLSAMLLVALALAPRSAAPARGALMRLGSRLGDASYALYLVHVPVVLFVYRMLDAPPLVAWTVAVGAALAVSIPFGALDMRLYAVLRRWVDRMPNWLQIASAGLFIVLYAAVAVAVAWNF